MVSQAGNGSPPPQGAKVRLIDSMLSEVAVKLSSSSSFNSTGTEVSPSVTTSCTTTEVCKSLTVGSAGTSAGIVTRRVLINTSKRYSGVPSVVTADSFGSSSLHAATSNKMGKTQ